MTTETVVDMGKIASPIAMPLAHAPARPNQQHTTVPTSEH